jgi:hypothetical protein
MAITGTSEDRPPRIRLGMEGGAMPSSGPLTASRRGWMTIANSWWGVSPRL